MEEKRIGQSCIKNVFLATILIDDGFINLFKANCSNSIHKGLLMGVEDLVL